ncbi:MAG: helix-turn-helix transcriptional regulator [Candidatus Heimdallarchaeota archaeon]|nr:helix-turn-helix transcriptional regulator [Candidatus Heimdallarchaeota archaeon]
MKLPRPTNEILSLMSNNASPMTPSDIRAALPHYSAKDIKYALRRLREKGIIRQKPNLLDMRRVYYRLINPDEISEIMSVLSPDEIETFTPLFTGALATS